MGDLGGTAAQNTKQKMCSRIAEMSHTRDDKSAPKEYYKIATSQNPVSHVGHTSPLVPNVVPELCPVSCSEQSSTSIQASKKTNVSSNMILRIPPRRIALCGGGIRGVAHVGVMKAFHDHGIFNHIKEVIGISAGAFIGLLWTLEYTIPQMELLALEFDFTVLRNFEPESILSFPLTFGLDDGSKIDKLITSVLKQKGFGPDVTFEQISAKYSMLFRCYATELQTLKFREFGSLKTPKTSVKFAVRASMALPFFYTPMKDPKSNLLFVDGAVLHNLPLAFLKEHEICETWGVLFIVQPSETVEPIQDIMQVVRHIYDCSTVMKSAPYMEKFGDKIICIPAGDFGTLQLGKTREERAQLIQRAYSITKKFMYSLSKPRHRRFSAS